MKTSRPYSILATAQRSPAEPGGARRSLAQSGFTMVEIAISLAIIGIALVAIIGVLPLGLREQSDNREQTVINQDATVLMQAICNGQRGLDDLTNYVYAITNYWTEYGMRGGVLNSGKNGYTYANDNVTWGYASGSPLTNGANIIGILSTPEYTSTKGIPFASLHDIGGYSNHVVAYVRSMSGLAVEKPPQPPNQIMVQDSFTYRVICATVPVQTSTNNMTAYTTNLQANLQEMRLTFLWPQLPNGGIGTGNQTFRTMVGGQLLFTTNSVGVSNLYFLQPQSFTSAP